MSEWQAIETAPKDRSVDLWGVEETKERNRSLMMVDYSRRFTNCFWGAPKYTRPSGFVMHCEEGWWQHIYGEKYRRIHRPTHWRLAPQPPKEKP